jgi:outer membrane protein assembly factor BamB
MNTLAGSDISRSFSRAILVAACAFATEAGAAPGDLKWEDTFDGSLASSDTARAIDARNGRVFAAGDVQSSEPGIFAVRAYSSETGTLLWSAQPGSGTNDEAHAVHASHNVVAVCGRLNDAEFGVVAYDQVTGGEAWRDTGTPGEARACKGESGRLIAAGLVFDEVTGPDVLVRAYDVATGVVLWEDRFDGGGNVADFANAVAIADGQLYVTGAVQQTPGNDDIFVRRYDAATGALAWQQLYSGSGGERDDAQAIAVAGNRVFVGGQATGARASSSLIIAFRTETGTRLWADSHRDEVVNALAAVGGRVIAASGPQVDATSAVVRAYDVRSGRLEWARSEGAAGAAVTVDTDDQYAYWGGWTAGADSFDTLFVQAVHVATGQTAWEDARANARAFELVVEGGGVFVAGSAVVSSGAPGDFLVRALVAR